jgi:GNAT superfamily N-acetyltransferase
VSQLAVRPLPLEQTRALRQAVLRPHLTVEDLAGHEPPGAVAFGAFDGDELVGVGLVGPDGEPGAWRIRGMATAEAARGRGAGMAVLGALVRHAQAHGAMSVWCNARVRAIPLYERAGLRVASEVFEPPDIGPHVRMELPLFQGFGAHVFEWFAGLERDNRSPTSPPPATSTSATSAARSRRCSTSWR